MTVLDIAGVVNKIWHKGLEQLEVVRTQKSTHTAKKPRNRGNSEKPPVIDH